jgi:2-dehydro-3-deoxyphosphogluconate aldolase/(4S)-4-hydroxy-2-oxoglutarate aldolase
LHRRKPPPHPSCSPVAKVADANNMLWVPGCMTATEIIAAETLGAKLVKLFPGNILGPSFMSGIRDLFPGLLFMPTGGVDITEESIGAWFKSGVCAVGMGSKLISKEVMETKQFDLLTTETAKVMAIINSCKT